MTLKTEPAVREFRHGSLPLKDPDPKQTPDAVKAFYAHIYPELTNAEIEGPEHKGAKIVYTFRKAVGTKGANPPRPRGNAITIADIESAQPLSDAFAQFVGDFDNKFAAHVERITAPSGLVQPLP